MAVKHYSGIDLQGNQLLNVVIHPSATAPSSPVEAMAWYDTTNNVLKIYDGAQWVEQNQQLTVAAGSSAFLSISNGEISFHNLAITTVTVDVTYTDLASFVAAEYATGTEFQEGDMIILTAATDQQQRSFIHNGGSAGDSTDFTRLQTDIDTSTIRNALNGASGVSYNSSTGEFSADVDDVTVQVGASGIEIKDSGVSTAKIANDAVDKNKIAADVAGNGLGQNVDGSLEINVDDSTVEISSDILQVKDAGITEAKLDSTLAAKINTDYAETFGDGEATSYTITHNLNSKDVMTMVYEISTGECVQCQITRDTVNQITVGAFPAPASNDLRILIRRMNV